MKAVMYHYVRPDGHRPPDYYYLDLDDFRRQLDYFAAAFNLIDRKTFLEAVAGDRRLPEDAVVLTFDDGLLDHYRFVYPELDARGLWGIFYVPTGPYRDEKLLDVHRIHLLVGRYGGAKLLDPLLDVVGEGMITDRRIEQFRTYTYRRQDDAEHTKRVKRILNYFVAEDARDEVLTRLEAEFSNATVDAGDYYISEDHLKEMHANGMLIGSHSVTHRVLSKLDVDEQRKEISSSFAFLNRVLDGLSVRTFCYPYGGFHTFTDDTERLLDASDCRFSFNVEPRDVSRSDVDDRPQALPRYDCNEFPHGDASGSLGP
ncbi:MAG: polysaccharide deacetylase family protein [Natronomonas sp.]|nr:polysaccharide deacetylase family protein [Natronomonas sp.]